ncbi:hypothetical protein [Arhodomonas sp. SL1]|uniref:hypothetical protein n=1 Tax=Arhodomonas sp. SL1 TaxID=3425691 RepID=UPI003F884AC7
MPRVLISTLIAMLVLGGIAGLSGNERLDQALEQTREQWVAAHTLTSEPLRQTLIDDLRYQTGRLLTQYPEHPEVLRWHRLVAQAQQQRWHRRGEDLSG